MKTQFNQETKIDYSESIKASAQILSLLDASVKKEIDVYTRQISISKNYLWMASIFVAFAIGIYDRIFGVNQQLVLSDALSQAHATALLIAISASSIAFYFSSKVFWNSKESTYVLDFPRLFMDDGAFLSSPKSSKSIYENYVYLVGSTYYAYEAQLNESVRRGKYLRISGRCIRTAFFFLILNIVLYLMEKLS